jgi:hypothetical protein
MWKEEVVAILGYYPRNWLKRLKKTTKNLSQDSRSSGRVLNSGLSKTKTDCKPLVHNIVSVHNNPPVEPILSQMDLFRIHCNIILPSTFRSLMCCLPLIFPTKTLYAFLLPPAYVWHMLLLPMCDICSSYLPHILDVITLTSPWWWRQQGPLKRW